MARKAKPKKVNFELILTGADSSQEDRATYQIKDKLIHSDLHHLRTARIAMAWRLRLKEDKDGLLTLGKAVKTTDLNKEFAAYDFIILLNKEAWQELDDKQREALVFHELEHCQPIFDKEGEQKQDDRGRLLWRLRKHDIEEFQSVVDKYGCWKAGIEKFARAALAKKKEPPLLKLAEAQ